MNYPLKQVLPLPSSPVLRVSSGKTRKSYSAADIEAADLKATERERERLSLELHDGLGQHLTGIAFLAKALANRLKADNKPEEIEAGQIVNLTNQAISSIRALARGLQPVATEDNALSVALAQLSVDTASIYGTECVYSADEMIRVSNQFAAHHIYRIAQEAVHNALKHGTAGTISIAFTENEKSLTLTVTNAGFLAEEITPDGIRDSGMGIASMRYRAKLLKARLSLENISGGKVRMKLLIDKKVAQSLRGTGEMV